MRGFLSLLLGFFVIGVFFQGTVSIAYATGVVILLADEQGNDLEPGTPCIVANKATHKGHLGTVMRDGAFRVNASEGERFELACQSSDGKAHVAKEILLTSRARTRLHQKATGLFELHPGPDGHFGF